MRKILRCKNIMIYYLKNFIKKKIKEKQISKNLYFRAIIHLIRYFLSKKYRKNKCLIDPSSEFFYNNKKLANYFSIPIFIAARILKKKRIFISINNDCNYSVGHIYAEINYLRELQHLEGKYSSSIIWFTTSRKEILGDAYHLFENENFKILFGGIKRIFLTFVAIKHPSISINGGVSHVNYILGRNNSHRITYNNLTKKRSKLMSKSQNFYLNKSKLCHYRESKNKLMQDLNIVKKYIVIQIKENSTNGTLKPLNPDLLLRTIKYFQDQHYQIVFAGREQFPRIFHNKSIINYANSKYASAVNDFLLIGHCSLVISSGSGFCEIASCFDKPLLVINVHHISQHFGQRKIVLPTLLSRKSKKFNAKVQHLYLCTYGPDNGFNTFDDFYILHMPTSEEIFMAAKELEGMLSDNVPPFTSLQKKIRDKGFCSLLSYGISRISDYYLSKHEYFFRN